MSITITPENKTTVTITNEEKTSSMTWVAATFTWDDSAPASWDKPNPLFKETKTNVTITNETKP